MRTKILTVVAAGALGLSGVALAGPALAAAGADSASEAVTSRVDRLKQALSGLVTDGTLTQEQADEVASTLDAADLGRGGGHGPGGPGGPGRGVALEAAATTLGLTQDELRTALRDGTTLAQLAEDKGVAVADLVTALVDAQKARIAQAVTDGRLTQAQADERVAGLTERVTELVNSTRPARGHGHGGGPRGDAAPDEASPSPSTPAPSTPAPSAPEGSSFGASGSTAPALTA